MKLWDREPKAKVDHLMELFKSLDNINCPECSTIFQNVGHCENSSAMADYLILQCPKCKTVRVAQFPLRGLDGIQKVRLAP